MKTNKKWLWVLGACAVGGFFIFTGVKEFRNSKRLAAEGKAVAAQVEDKEMERRRRGRKSYYLELQFQTEAGQTVSQRVKVSSAQYNAANPGGTVPLHYLPSDPSICAVGDKVTTKWTEFLWGAGAFIVAGFLGFNRSDDDGGGDEAGEGAANAAATPEPPASSDQEAA